VEDREVGGGGGVGDAPVGLTVDASVYVAALHPGDRFHPDSAAMVTSDEFVATSVVCPMLVLPECAGAVSRATGEVALGHAAIVTLTYAPNVELVEFTAERAQSADRLAADLRLRGADAVYVQVAQEHGTQLVTWDDQMRERGAAVVPTMTPTDWLASLEPTAGE
jgi:predicted nucleic acid-binding protein